MSARDLNLIVTPRALADLRGILFYTLEQWGLEQAATYEERIWAAINHLIRNPNMGRVSRRVEGGMRSFTVDNHTVYYRIDSENIFILRIVH